MLETIISLFLALSGSIIFLTKIRPALYHESHDNLFLQSQTAFWFFISMANCPLVWILDSAKVHRNSLLLWLFNQNTHCCQYDKPSTSFIIADKWNATNNLHRPRDHYSVMDMITRLEMVCGRGLRRARSVRPGPASPGPGRDWIPGLNSINSGAGRDPGT